MDNVCKYREPKAVELIAIAVCVLHHWRGWAFRTCNGEYSLIMGHKKKNPLII